MLNLSFFPLAGMPSVTLTDAAEMRLQSISFFLFGLLVSTFFVRMLWNYLATDFGWPRLSYLKSLGLVTLWGLLFIVVLTMISGARELMTPGAWEKKGSTYKLVEPPKPADEAYERELATKRRDKLEDLRATLWDHATKNDNTFPEARDVVRRDIWTLPDNPTAKYVYVPGQKLGGDPQPLVYEPDIFGPERLVLMTDGKVRTMKLPDILAMRRVSAR